MSIRSIAVFGIGVVVLIFSAFLIDTPIIGVMLVASIACMLCAILIQLGALTDTLKQKRNTPKR